MSADVNLIVETLFENSIRKGDFSRINHQQGVNLKEFDKNFDFMFGENINYYQIGKA